MAKKNDKQDLEVLNTVEPSWAEEAPPPAPEEATSATEPPPPPAPEAEAVTAEDPPPPPPKTFALTNKTVKLAVINTERRTLRVGPRETIMLLPGEHECPEIQGLLRSRPPQIQLSTPQP